jgi:hypothetical protein
MPGRRFSEGKKKSEGWTCCTIETVSANISSSMCIWTDFKNISLMEMQRLIVVSFKRFHFELVDSKKPGKTTCHWIVIETRIFMSGVCKNKEY